MDLANRITVITGATGGLGRVVSQRFADSGARLALVSTSPEKLDSLARQLDLPPDRALTIAADLSQPEAAPRVLQAVLEGFGRADLLLHLVGGWIGGRPVAQVAAEDLSLMLQQHVWTTFYLAQAFGPHLVANGWGRLIVVSAPSATAPQANGAPYAMAKAAQETLLLTLAQEFKGTGVTANVLRVNAIDAGHERDRQPLSKSAFWATPEEIAAAMLYLCSEAAGIINGARIPLYGSP